MPVCCRCKEEKPNSDFFKHSKRPSGLQGNCKPCSREATHEWRLKNPERARQLDKRYYDKSGLDNHRRRVYGLTPEEIRMMESSQDNKCALCGTLTKLHIDHDHNSGVVRDLLCRGCNHGLGNFRDDTDLLRKAIDYLERHRISGMAEDQSSV